MKCNDLFFIQTLKAQHPAKYLHRCNDPFFGDNYILALDTAGECQKSFSDMYKIASHVWSQSPHDAGKGTVTKDVDGLFTPQAPSAHTHSVMPPNQYHFTYNAAPPFDPINVISDGTDWNIEEKKPKCGCGGWSVGATKHPSYCDLYEPENN